jgi:4-hydroxy-tetrahydrodipicolinate synthase
MITPFDKDNNVDFAKAQLLAEYLLNNGSDGLVVAGTTGESPTLSKEEKLKLFAAVKEAAKGKGLVVAGTSSYDTAASVELTKKAESVGADAILAVAPYYNKPPQEGLYRHFASLAAATSLPLMLYNIPGRCGVNLLPATVVRLSALNNIVALKEASGSMDQFAEIRSLCGNDFHLYSGDDSLTLPFLSLGASGVISVASHIAAIPIQNMINSFKKGDTLNAMNIHYRLFPLFKGLFAMTNPIAIKYCVNKLIMDSGSYRPPLIGPDDNEKKALDALIASISEVI